MTHIIIFAFMDTPSYFKKKDTKMIVLCLYENKNQSRLY